MKAIIKFKKHSLYYKNGCKEQEHTKLSEIHYNFANTDRIAFESDKRSTGQVFSIDDIDEIEITDK